jgi:hypothetical protein
VRLGGPNVSAARTPNKYDKNDLDESCLFVFGDLAILRGVTLKADIQPLPRIGCPNDAMDE